ncbi:hypothetical protein ACNOYE_36715 [Nannocystaceae bacterium ST9]
MNTRARRLSMVVTLALLALGIWPLLRPLTDLEIWVPADRLVLVVDTTIENAIVEQIFADPQLRTRVLVLPSSNASTPVVSQSCAHLATILGERHPSFEYAPQSLLCYLARDLADSLLMNAPEDPSDVIWFEGFSPVSHESEPTAWARYGLEFAHGGLQIIGRGRRPGSGPGYNREIGY